MFAHLQKPSVLILGLGESGLAMARWCAMYGCRVRVADTRTAPAKLAALRKIEAPVAVEYQKADEALAPAQDELPVGTLAEVSNKSEGEPIGVSSAEGLDTKRASALEFIPGAFSVDLLEGIELIGISPGLVPTEDALAAVLAEAKLKAIPIWSEIEFFAQALHTLARESAYSPKVIAITGTNGKTTVTQLTGKICAHAGKRVALAGNISPAALDKLADYLAQANQESYPEIWVLELSSFQLAYTYSLNADAATILNITEDHLDWHTGMEDYINAKARIFGKGTTCVVNRADTNVMRVACARSTAAEQPQTQLPRTLVTFGADIPMQPNSFGLLIENEIEWLAYVDQENDGMVRGRSRRVLATNANGAYAMTPTRVHRLMPSAALRIRGRHNALNALASLALARALDLPLAALLHGLRDYRGEPHRVQSVAIVHDVEYIDDSKGTNVGATLAAIDAVADKKNPEKKVVLIAGGVGKGQDFSPLIKALPPVARALILIGQDAAQLRETLSAFVLTEECATLEQAVHRAAQLAQPGDRVLLSPACASLDMFANYAHRAQCFIDAVAALKTEAGEVV